MHRLTKGQVRIELRNQLSAIHWKVTYDSDYGAPGPLAYKVESLFINRKIEESGRPVPKIVRLGSLREIAGEVDLGHNTAALKTALLQNATSNITAKISYRTKEGGEQWLEAVFNRYSVIFTGEALPGGGKADAVYLVLNDIYQEVLNTAVFRPLDYDYMKTLPPISQRFYEIASYQVFGALKLGNPRAKLLYSEYCLLSTATRYFDFDHVKKQMYKILRPHVRSGYLAKIEYQAITNEAGEADWIMMLTPGPNADREYRAFTGKNHPAQKALSQGEALHLPFPETEFQPIPVLVKPKSIKTTKSKASPQSKTGGTTFRAKEPLQGQLISPLGLNGEVATDASANEIATAKSEATGQASLDELVESLVAAELNRGDAQRFAQDKAEVCRRQLLYLPYVEKFTSSRGAYLRRAIEGDFGPPPAYSKAREQEAASAREKRGRSATESAASLEKARESHKNRFYAEFCEFAARYIAGLEKTHPEAFTAFAEEENRIRVNLESGPFAGRPLTLRSLETFDEPTSRVERFFAFLRDAGHKWRFLSPRLLAALDFWEWDKAHNPHAFLD